MISNMLSKQLSMQVAENISHSAIITNPHIPTSLPDSDSQVGLVLFLKIVFYFMFVVKIIELSFLRRKRYSLKERIYRKFLFAHQELLKYFTDEDKSTMQTTLSNTIKNASIDYDPKKSKARRPSKSVIFKISHNTYYDPINWRQQEIRLSLVRQRAARQSRMDASSFQQKKMEDQFVEREDLLGLNYKQDEIIASQVKPIDQKEQNLHNQQVIKSNIINDGINFL